MKGQRAIGMSLLYEMKMPPQGRHSVIAHRRRHGVFKAHTVNCVQTLGFGSSLT
jgi:hypothetical protein